MFEIFDGHRLVYSTTSSKELSSIVSRLCILASKDNITLTASGSRSVERNVLNALRASVFEASLECDGAPPAERFTPPFDPLLNIESAGSFDKDNSLSIYI